MTAQGNPLWYAGRFIQWGLRTLARPAQEAEYRELVNRYLDDPSFRSAVRELADGLGLDVLDVSEHGLVLAPHDDSIFGLRPADFRPNASKADDRLLDGLAQIAIAATVFPRARDLEEDPDVVRPPVTVEEVEGLLRQLCEQLSAEAQGAPDPEASDEKRGLVEAWRVYQQRSEIVDTRDGRKGARGTRRLIEYAFERMRELGCFTQVRYAGNPAWQPTRRYQILFQQLAASSLFQIVRDALSAAAAKESL